MPEEEKNTPELEPLDPKKQQIMSDLFEKHGFEPPIQSIKNQAPKHRPISAVLLDCVVALLLEIEALKERIIEEKEI